MSAPSLPASPSPSTLRLVELLEGASRGAVQRLLIDLWSTDNQQTPPRGGLLPEPGPNPLRLDDAADWEGQAASFVDEIERPARASKRRAKQPAHDHVIGWFDAAYPPRLRHIPDPPLVLYVRGPWQRLHEPQIAIVGARRCTRSGRRIAEQFADELARSGVGVTSGLALGIDGAAHRGALRSRTHAGSPVHFGAALDAGTTTAVMGAGLQKFYPASHARLAEDILSAGGTLCSEYPDSRPPRPYQFPERNRIIAGLALGTIVIEAGARSGSLITARYALEQGRDVYAVPGPLDSLVSVGCHQLIRQGAALVTSASDVLGELRVALKSQDVMPDDVAVLAADKGAEHKSSALPELSTLQRTVFDILSVDAQLLEEILASLQRPTTNQDAKSRTKSQLVLGQVLQALTELEMLGIVAKKPLGYIRLL